jgi:3-methyladenine DNA glycosylase AlkD
MSLIEDLEAFKTVETATSENRYFKTGEGQYQSHDLFWLIPAADINRIVAKYAKEMTFSDIEALLKEPIHEIRSCAFAILTQQMRKADESKQQEIVTFYLNHLERANGWDLIDISAPGILGEWILRQGDDHILDELAQSENLWRRRASIVSTWTLIRHNQLDSTYRIAETLLKDSEDLIHKACGWMLREAGKKDRVRLDRFLKTHYARIPRTTLRYAIEKHEETERQALLKGNFREE